MPLTTPTKIVQAANAAARATAEPLAVTVDYNDGTAVDPPAGTIFTSQQEIDDFLTDNSAVAFKHLTAVWYALPPFISHAVTITLAAGVHRPDPAAGTFAWDLSGRQEAGGSITIQGSATYDTLVASESITGLQLDSGDPYVDVGGTPYAGLDLRGTFAVLSTGQKVLIHDHTDSRLFLIDPLSPDPTGGTVVVAEPSTKLRNSLDDSATFGGITLRIEWTVPADFSSFVLQDVLVDPFGNSSFGFFLDAGSRMAFRRFVLDNLSMIAAFGKTPNGHCVGISSNAVAFAYPGYGFAVRCVRPAAGGADNTLRVLNGEFFSNSAYFGGSEDGVVVDGANARLPITRTVFDAVGTAASCTLQNGGTFEVFFSTTGKRSEFRNNPVPSILMQTGSTLTFGTLASTPLRFVNNTAPCILMQGSAHLLAELTTGLKDGGGNTDVGIEVQGSGNVVKLNAAVDLTGTNGDLRVEGEIAAYTELPPIATPIFTIRGNSIGRG
jgi:hypothetical protein